MPPSEPQTPTPQSVLEPLLEVRSSASTSSRSRASTGTRRAQLETFRRALEDALDQALEHRDHILALADREDPESQREKQRLLEYAEQAVERVRMIADVCVGALFAHDKPKARESERKARLDVVNRLLEGDERAYEPRAAMAREIRAQHAPFHWMLEFPEVFWEERQDPLDPQAEKRAAYMEAFVGNPPFMGKNAISDANRPGYIDWSMARYPARPTTTKATCFDVSESLYAIAY